MEIRVRPSNLRFVAGFAGDWLRDREGLRDRDRDLLRDRDCDRLRDREPDRSLRARLRFCFSMSLRSQRDGCL